MTARCFVTGCPKACVCSRYVRFRDLTTPQFGDIAFSCAVPTDPKTQPNGAKVKYIHFLDIHHKENAHEPR